jgi:hypothetical protein
VPAAVPSLTQGSSSNVPDAWFSNTALAGRSAGSVFKLGSVPMKAEPSTLASTTLVPLAEPSVTHNAVPPPA